MKDTKQVRVTRRYADLVEGVYAAMHGGTAQQALDAALLTWIELNAPDEIRRVIYDKQPDKEAG